MGVKTCSGICTLQKKKGSAMMTAIVGGFSMILYGFTLFFSPVTAYTPSVQHIALNAIL